MIPEASAGCVCQFSIASTVVMEPKKQNKSWGILSAVGPSTPVRRMGINFGAPGDRKDGAGKEWFSYPRPASRGRLEYVFDLKPDVNAGGGWYSRNAESVSVAGDDEPWLFTSGGRGLKKFEIPMLGKDDAARSYRVRLYFANVDDKDTGPFDVKLQGQVVASAVNIPTANAGPVKPTIKEFEGVQVTENLLVELVADSNTTAVLSAIEVTSEQ
jgi:hypothetical protein